MFILNTVSTSDAFSDWNFWFAFFNLLMVLINTFIARKIYKDRKEVTQIKNEINTIINNNVSAQAVASVIVNDEDKIKELSASIATALIAEKTPKFDFDKKTKTLNINIPETNHELNLERK